MHRIHKFLDKIQIQPNGCWEWMGYRNENNYGVLNHKLTHRIMWELIHKPLISSIHVLHTCDNPPCCNPNHLFLGDQIDNMLDRDSKNRVAHGENHYKHKLTLEQIELIKKLRHTGLTMKQLGDQFNVCAATICHVLHGNRYAREYETLA